MIYFFEKMCYNFSNDVSLNVEGVMIMKMRKIDVFKVVVTIITLILIVGIIAYIAPVLMELNTKEGQVAFRDKVNNSGFLGLLWLFGIELAQIFLIFVPGEPIEVLAGMCYGSLWGTIFIMVSAAIISTSIFLMVRKFGKKFVYNFCDKEKVAKVENSKLFQNPKKIERILLILFLLPGTPKDFFAYVSGLLPIKPVNYIIISSLARFPSVISSTLAGENIALGNWKISIIIYAITFLVVGVIIFFMNKLDKTKLTEETLNTLKKENI